MLAIGVCAALLGTPQVWADEQDDYVAGIAAHERGDVIAAMELLRRAAGAGHVAAMVRLGFLLDEAEENDAAFQVYLQAAEAGSPEGALAVGVMYANGEGVTKDPHKALIWITRAADAGYGPAQVTLAQLYLRGEMGVVRDRDQALKILDRSARAGYEPAKQQLEALRNEKTSQAKQ